MKAASFDYVRPRDVAEALAALGQADGGAKLMAGGQSLGPMLNLRLARPSLIVDVSRLDALQAHRGHRPRLAHRCGRHAFARSRTGADSFPAARCCARWRPASPIGRCAIAAPWAAAWRMPIRRRTGRLRSRRLARPSTSGAVPARAPFRPSGSRSAPSRRCCARTRSSSRSMCPSCRRRGVTATTSSAARPAISRKRARRRCSIRNPERRGSISRRCGRHRSSSSTLARRIAESGKAAASEQAVAQALAEAAGDLDPVERRMATAAVTRALQQVFAP